MNQSCSNDSGIDSQDPLTVLFSFENFWPGFDPKNNFLSRIYKINGKSFNYGNAQSPNRILVKSVFENISEFELLLRATKHFLRKFQMVENLANRRRKTLPQIENSILYIGENIRVPISSRFSLSFCLDDIHAQNIYYPILFDTLLISKLGQFDPLFGSVIPYQSLKEERKPSTKPRKLACIFFANQTPLRWRLVQEFRRFGEVDVFGRSVENYVEDRSELIGEYKYVLCPENDYYPGYVTEKILHAYAMQSVPIYWGGLSDAQFINKRSILEIHPTDNISTKVAEFVNLDSQQYAEIYKQPLIIGEPDWGRVYSQIQKWIRLILQDNQGTK